MSDSNIIYLGTKLTATLGTGTKRNPFKYFSRGKEASVMTHIEKLKNKFQEFFVLISKGIIINDSITQNLSKEKYKIYIIGQYNSKEDNFNNAEEIKSYIKNKPLPYKMDQFNKNLKKFKKRISEDVNVETEFIGNLATSFNKQISLSGNITFVNINFKRDLIINLKNDNKYIKFINCYFNRLNSGLNLNGSFELNNTDKCLIYNCFFKNCSHAMNKGAINLNNVNQVNIYNCLFSECGNGIIGNANIDSSLDQNGVHIKNCKIYHSDFNGIVLKFPRTNSGYQNKIVNVDCSYSGGNGFKVWGGTFENCKAVWNKFMGFICIECKYLYKCYSNNNETGILVTMTNNNKFSKDNNYTYYSETELVREYSDIMANDKKVILKKQFNINFFNCSVKGNLRGSGIVFKLPYSFSIIANSEITGNQGDIITLYNPAKHKNDYYFNGGGIKGYKDNSLLIIHSTIAGNLGYGIFIMDDIRKIKLQYEYDSSIEESDLSKVIDSEEDKIFGQSTILTSYYNIDSCNKISGTNSCDIEYSNDKYIVKSSKSIGDVVDIDDNKSQCQASSICSIGNYSNSNITHIGHLYLINSIIVSNAGGQIIRYFKFNKNSYRYKNINSVISGYKSDIKVSLPENVCSWNPYKGIFYKQEIDTFTNEPINRIYPLHNLVKTFMSIDKTDGVSVFFKDKDSSIFKGLPLGSDIINARDDIDVRYNLKEDENYDTLTEGSNKPLKGIKLFVNNKFDAGYGDSGLFPQNSKILNLIGEETNETLYSLFFKGNTFFPIVESNICESSNDCPDKNNKCINKKCYDYGDNNYLGNFDFTNNKKLEDTNNYFKNNYTDTILEYVMNNLFKNILKYDFDSNIRDFNKEPYVGCFEKIDNYCEYSWNRTGRKYNFKDNKFDSKIHCCINSNIDGCTPVSGDTALLDRGLVVDLESTSKKTDEQVELEEKCKKYQSIFNTKNIITPNINIETQELNCKLPNFDMYEFKGPIYENKFRCGKNCQVNWNKTFNIDLDHESSLDFTGGKNLYIRTGEIKKLSSNWKEIFPNLTADQAKTLYPNECPTTAEFVYDDNCPIDTSNDNINNWYKNEENKKYLPLIPDGCPEYGGKKCPPNLIQVSYNEDVEMDQGAFDISNMVDDILSDSGKVTSLLNKIDTDLIDSKIDLDNDPKLLKYKCERAGLIDPILNSTTLNSAVSKKFNTEPTVKSRKPYVLVIVIIILIIATVVGVLFLF
jgi:hypothetical protein